MYHEPFIRGLLRLLRDNRDVAVHAQWGCEVAGVNEAAIRVLHEGSLTGVPRVHFGVVDKAIMSIFGRYAGREQYEQRRRQKAERNNSVAHIEVKGRPGARARFGGSENEEERVRG